MLRRNRQRTKIGRPLLHMVPNLFTIMSLCAGLTGLRYGLDGRFDLAVAMIIVSGILDGLDGRSARLLNIQTKLGAELDSLADCFNFGVAPALLVYLWTLDDIRGAGWAITLLFAVCCALRLARFNSELEDPNKPRWMIYFFTGIPAPGAAMLALTPMMLSFVVGDGWPKSWALNAAMLIFVALMMVSRVPTFSVKRLRVRPDQIMPTLIGAALGVTFLVTEPWLTLSVLSVVYLLSIPVSFWTARRMRMEEMAQPAPVPAAPAPSEPIARGSNDRVIPLERRHGQP